MKSKVKEFLMLTLGTSLVAVGVYFFKFTNHFSFGGVSGISVVLGELIPWLTPGAIVSILNVLFLILGFVFLNKGFGIKTVYCSLLLSGLTWGLEYLLPLQAPITDQKMLELVFAAALPAIGSAIVFNASGSTGGTDILAMILKKYTRISNIGMALLLSDLVISLSSIFVFDIETGLYSLLGLTMKAFLVDMVIENINLKKSFTIVTSHPEEVCRYINAQLRRGATIWQAKGSFTGTEAWMIMAVMNRYQASMLRKYLKEIDPHAFVLIANATTIIGKGFREI